MPLKTVLHKMLVLFLIVPVPHLKFKFFPIVPFTNPVCSDPLFFCPYRRIHGQSCSLALSLSLSLLLTLSAMPSFYNNTLDVKFKRSSNQNLVIIMIVTFLISHNSIAQFNECKNLYACDCSVFPASPAANPSLTLATFAR